MFVDVQGWRKHRQAQDEGSEMEKLQGGVRFVFRREEKGKRDDLVGIDSPKHDKILSRSPGLLSKCNYP